MPATAPTSDAPPPPPASAALPFPPLVRLRFGFVAADALRLPDFPGSAWRGLLGQGLRRTACVTRAPTCAGCLLLGHCVYSTLFETPADGDQGSYSALPHPFVLDLDPHAPHRLDPGQAFHLGITLLGAAVAQAPYLVHALNLAGQLGFGRARGRFRLVDVRAETNPGADDWRLVFTADEGVWHAPAPPPLLPPAPPTGAADRASPITLRLALTTPLRIKRDGRYVGPRHLTAADLLHALTRRLRTLARLQGGDPNAFDLRSADRLAAALTLTADALHWHDWTRYSSRQDSQMQFGGILGVLTLTGPTLPALWPALWLGQWVHVGKGTAFGLGAYRVLADGAQTADHNLAAPDGGAPAVAS